MRYQNWDVLVFPENSLVPAQEFKTACHVIHDQDTLHQRASVFLLPTVTSFIQALPAGEAFRISVHSWETPEPSRLAQRSSKSAELIMFEARIIVDGRLVGSKVFGRTGKWPITIDTSIHMDKNGDMESLRFPAFHSELLKQSYWNAGDELGRIKVVIAEGYAGDPSSATLDRLKNIVAFSFQHAPLDVLEAAALAWPNAAMWRQVSLNLSFLPQNTSPQHAQQPGVETHSHSPRPRASLAPAILPPPALGSMLPPGIPAYPRAVPDPFTESVHNWRQNSSTDVSMPDYSSSSSWASHSRRITDPISVDRSERRFDTLQSAGAFESICEALEPSAPDNTPQSIIPDRSISTVSIKTAPVQAEPDYFRIIKFDDSQFNTPPRTTSAITGIKSRKENMQVSPGIGEGRGVADNVRRVAQPFHSMTSGGAKRQRMVTPASTKVIDIEDEPRSSPTRKLSQALLAPEGERGALSGIEPNIV